MIFLTGDTHGNFKRVAAFCDKIGTTKDDVLIVLGDAGINYAVDMRELDYKHQLQLLPITLFCLHGNHERRPSTLNYTQTVWNGGSVYVEYDFPSLLFAKDGELYSLGDKKAIVIGGAYSIDKPLRLANGWHWFPDEQPSAEIKLDVEHRLDSIDWNVDVVLSHTCPYKYMPREVFMSGVDQSRVDNSTEEWLDAIEDRLLYERWYCGHFHTSKVIDKLRFMADDFIEFR